ncbi:hypothetical protein ACIB24_06295 [Spongisporangium articulatum]|uniref:Uncharacterized protein n=1 Tax=Spongisporangium articulatum TaxID=3362603 RepID=A0ABW8AJX4_9ACTN
MRWDRLFDDLEARFEAEQRAEADGELAELIRAEYAGVSLVDRLRAQLGGRVGWWLREAATFDAELIELGKDWVLLRRAQVELLVPLAAVVGLRGLARPASAGSGPLARRLAIGSVLRRLARDRVEVSMRLVGAGGHGEVVGTIDRVGADHLDVAEHPSGTFRRADQVVQVRTVPLAAVVWVAVHA